MSANNHALIIKKDGSVWGCGYNAYGQLGLGDTTNRLYFTKIPIDDAKAVSCGENHSAILKNDGTLWMCGRNNYGQLGTGNGTTLNVFTKVASDVKDVSCGNNHTSCLRLSSNTLFSTGHNSYGQFGDGTTTSSTVFKSSGYSGFVRVICGFNNTFALRDNGILSGTGQNTSGQLGDGTVTNFKYFYTIASNVEDVSCGDNFVVILKNDGTVWGCGINSNGQLGTGDKVSTRAFVYTGQANVKAIATCSRSTTLLKNDNSVWVCGQDNYGQLSATSTTDKSEFIKRPSSSIINVDVVSGGQYFFMALDSDGRPGFSGKNTYGQFGVGNTYNWYGLSYSTTTSASCVKRLPNGRYSPSISLIKDADSYYAIENKKLVPVEVTDIEKDVENLGTFTTTILPNVSVLPDRFSLISNQDINIGINGIKEMSQMIVASSDFSTGAADYISYFKSTCSVSAAAKIRIAISFDSGMSWKSHNGTDFTDLMIQIPLKQYKDLSELELEKWNLAKDAILEYGVNPNSLELIDFNSLEFDTIRFAYATSLNTYTDVAKNKSLTWKFDSDGGIEKIKNQDLDVKLTLYGVEITPSTDLEIIKINTITH